MPSQVPLPRRRPVKDATIDALTDSMKTVSLQKGSTYHPAIAQESDVLRPFLQGLPNATLPTRSPTCPKSLEDLLIGANERRAAELLQRVDEAMAKQTELSSILKEPEVLPVPRFMVENAKVDNLYTLPRAPLSPSQQSDKDSGIGSSIVSTSEKLEQAGHNTKATSAVTRSYSGDRNTAVRTLSHFAQLQIIKHLIQPILRESSLKEFHPLIRDIPAQITNNDISTLRDLEKTLIFLAPDYSHSPQDYRSFCETSIRCLHLTANNIHESDRCLPTDRPYSTSYFLDLVDQIRRYASILAASRERTAEGEDLDDMDANVIDRIELVGGMTDNGKPAVLAHVRNGKHISLADGQPIKPDYLAAAAKRPAVESNIDDDSAHRSMARRKKNAPIQTYYCRHAGCTKHFKRPCDLTKHIRTHERPYKCPKEDCKYHELGWPTEKECERHVNDKHSDSPTMYKCIAKDCPYTSKRESNCKQHMEKAHNIPYVRSKSTTTKGKAPVGRVPKVVAGSRSDSTVNSPLTPPALSPSVISTVDSESAASTGAESRPEFSFADTPFDFNPDFTSHFNTEFLIPSPSVPITPAGTDDDRRTSFSTSTEITNYSPFDVPMNDFDQAMFKTQDYDFAMFGDDMQGLGLPDPIANANMYSSSNDAMQQYQDMNFSPGAQDLTLGGGFTDALSSEPMFSNDFELFRSNNEAGPSRISNNMQQNTGSLGNMGGQFSQNTQAQQTDILTLFPEIAGPQF